MQRRTSYFSIRPSPLSRHADVRVNLFSSPKSSLRPSDMYTFFEISEAAALWRSESSGRGRRDEDFPPIGNRERSHRRERPQQFWLMRLSVHAISPMIRGSLDRPNIPSH